MSEFQQAEVDVILRPVALLTATPEELAERLGITFATDTDDFDEYVWASGMVGGEPFGLMRYTRSPESGTELWGRETAEAFLDAFLDLRASWQRRSGDGDASAN